MSIQGESQHLHSYDDHHTFQQHYEEIQVIDDSPTSPIEHSPRSIPPFPAFTLASIKIQHSQKPVIQLGISGRQTRGTALTKHTVFLIKGYDKHGQINVERRFNQFHQMRVALVKRWPGCFVPSIPSKNAIMKNDEEFNRKRERYLNDFLRKMIELPHLYNSEEFQALLRSKQKDLSSSFEQWPNPTLQNVIAKYKECFGQELMGKEITQLTRQQIQVFSQRIHKNQQVLSLFRGYTKSLAIARDNLNEQYNKHFGNIMRNYEKVCLSEYANGKQEKLLYLNPQKSNLSQRLEQVTILHKNNPYWLLYDLIKNEQRDGRAFFQILQAREHFMHKQKSLQNKLQQQQKAIQQPSAVRATLRSITSKTTPDEVKYKLEMQSQELKREKQNVQILHDIITALIAYIEINEYKKRKATFYQNVIKRWSGLEGEYAKRMQQIWSQNKQAASMISLKQFNKV